MAAKATLILSKDKIDLEMIFFLISSQSNILLINISEDFSDDDLCLEVPAIFGLSLSVSNAYDFFLAWIENHVEQPIIIADKGNFSFKPFLIRDNIFKGDLAACYQEIKNILSVMSPTDVSTTACEFVQINISTLEHFGLLENDIYIELKTGRKLKIFSKGDRLTKEDIKRYVQKGIYQLFFKTNEIESTVLKIEQNLNDLVKDPNDQNLAEQKVDIPVAPKVKTISDIIKEKYIDAPMDFNFPFNIEKVHVYTLKQVAKDILETYMTHEMIAQSLLKLADAPSTYQYVKKRIGYMSNILLAISKELEWETKSVIERFVYASLIHDIILFDRLDLLKLQYNEDCETLSASDKTLFLSHPKEAVLIVKYDRFAPPNVDSIILQHHERLDGNGFPEGLNKHKISPYSAAFIMAINFSQYILDFPNWNIKEYLLLIDAEYKGGNFVKPFHALESLCKNKLVS